MRINQKNFKLAVEGTGGVQSAIASKLGVTRQSVNVYINKFPEMKELLDEERTKIVDMAENKLYVAAKDGQKWAIEKILHTIGKDRGLKEVQETETTHKGEGITLVITNANGDEKRTRE